MRHDVDEQSYVALAKKFPATAVIHQARSEFVLDGMGTLIDAQWVLTAGHIASELAPGDSVEVGGRRYEIAELVQYPDWHGVTSWEDVKRDIALIRLRTRVTGIKPARIYTGNDEATMTLTVVGEGRHGTGLTGPVDDDATMRAATNRVFEVRDREIVFRFDAPGDPGTTPLEGICGDGDSGGPAYLVRRGVVYVVGVSSAQDARPVRKQLGHYGVLELYPRVSAYSKWIRAVIAGSTPSANR